MVETAEATDTASNGQVGGIGSPTSATVATSPEEDAAPRTVELRRRWRTVYATNHPATGSGAEAAGAGDR